MSNESTLTGVVSDIGTLPDRTSINGQDLKKLVESALAWLKNNQQVVNSLNVFPVPDGDTGTNMLLTMQAAYNEIVNSNETTIKKSSFRPGLE